MRIIYTSLVSSNNIQNMPNMKTEHSKYLSVLDCVNHQ